jgi:undecaprenyl diphosphate synthase
VTHPSSTQEVPGHGAIPRHVAIIMDGNGRWAKQRRLPRVAGHKRGVEAVRAVVRACAERGVRFLTLFAFSSENWRRPAEEVALLMQLFRSALSSEVEKLHRNGIRLRVIGNLERFDPRMRALIDQAEQLTAGNPGLTLTIAANYGGRWDILQALTRLVREQQAGTLREIGEQRVSNFLLWQLAYTELYFTETLWPDFDAAALDAAFASYASRERRFGRTSEQLEQAQSQSPAANGVVA